MAVFIIDQGILPAFGHWVFESVIHIPEYIRLKVKNPTMKLMVGAYKPYKLLYTKYFQIDSSDILYEIPEISERIYPTCIPLLESLEVSDLHRELIQGILPPVSNDIIQTEYSIFPRQDKYNYKGNDIPICYKAIIDYIDRVGIPYTIYHTSIVKDLLFQIDQVRRSKVLIIPDGSAFIVNGLFASNVTIYVVGRICTEEQAMMYPQIAYLRDLIKKKNQVYWFKKDTDFIEFLKTGIYIKPHFKKQQGKTLERWL
jgi:hypothetical protein